MAACEEGAIEGPDSGEDEDFCRDLLQFPMAEPPVSPLAATAAAVTAALSPPQVDEALRDRCRATFAAETEAAPAFGSSLEAQLFEAHGYSTGNAYRDAVRRVTAFLRRGVVKTAVAHGTLLISRIISAALSCTLSELVENVQEEEDYARGFQLGPYFLCAELAERVASCLDAPSLARLAATSTLVRPCALNGRVWRAAVQKDFLTMGDSDNSEEGAEGEGGSDEEGAVGAGAGSMRLCRKRPREAPSLRGSGSGGSSGSGSGGGEQSDAVPQPYLLASLSTSSGASTLTSGGGLSSSSTSLFMDKHSDETWAQCYRRLALVQARQRRRAAAATALCSRCGQHRAAVRTHWSNVRVVIYHECQSCGFVEVQEEEDISLRMFKSAAW